MADIKSFQDIPGEIANGDFSSVKQAFADIHSQGEGYVRDNPSQAVFSALAAGFVLRLLPVGSIVGALVRLLMFAARPAIFIYGAVTLYRHFQQPPASHDE